MHQIARGWFRAAGIEPRAAMELGHAAMRNLISAGLGASILPIEAVMGDSSNAPVVLRPLDPPVTRTLAIIRRSDKPDEPALTAGPRGVAGDQESPARATRVSERLGRGAARRRACAYSPSQRAMMLRCISRGARVDRAPIASRSARSTSYSAMKP